MESRSDERVMAAQVTGSVGVRQAAIQRAETSSKTGKSACKTAI